MSKLKIAHIITGLYTGGAETMLSKLVLNMDRERFENIVMSMATADTMLGRRINENGVPVISLGIRPLHKAPFGFFKLLKLINKERPDIIQTWLYHADFVGLLISSLTSRAPVLWNIRGADLDPKDHPRSLFWLLKVLAKLSRKPKAVIINSECGKKYHERIGYKPVSWKVIPNGFDTDKFKPLPDARKKLHASLELNESMKVIGLVARYHPMKDHATFLSAAGELRKKRDDIHFVLVGTDIDNNNLAITKQIQDEGLNGSVSLLGERYDISEITAGFDLATCSSYSEGFPNVVGEAMSCGVPCVVTDTGDMREIVGPCGIVVNTREPLELANAWDEMLSKGPGELEKIGVAARKRIIDLYSIEAVISQYEKLYESINAK